MPRLRNIGRMNLPQIDTKLLTLLIEIAALKAQCLRSVRDVPVIPFQFGQNRLAFKIPNTVSKRPSRIVSSSAPSFVRSRQCHIDNL